MNALSPLKMSTPSVKLESPVILLDALEGESPYALTLALKPSWVAQVLEKTDAEVQGPFEVELELSELSGGEYLLRGRLGGNMTVPCARCLADSKVDASAPLCVSFVPELQYRQELAEMGDVQGDDSSLAESDRQPYRGKEIDLRPLLGEQILVAYPMRTLCELGEACLGLCGQCGLDLNAVARGELPPCDCAAAEQVVDEAPSPQQAAWERALRQFGEGKKN